jgi:beta-glucosidase
VLDGIKNYTSGKSAVTYVKGCDIVDPTWPDSEIIPTPLSDAEKAGIAEAVEAATAADVIVAVLGEDEERVGESLTRTSLDLPGRQQQLLEALHATGKPVILVLVNGQPLTINWADQYINGIIETWFSNAKGGQALAEVLFGAVNPGGKLPITFPKTTGQIEFNFPFKPGSHANQPKDGPNGFGKTQVNGALYPFGHGLSYTTFEFSNLKVSPLIQNAQGEITVTADVTNTGKRKGDEVVQLYIKDEYSSVITYDYDLRGFERVTLNPGETKTVKFTLQPDDLALLDKNMNWVTEPGKFQAWIGNSSQNIALKTTFEIK